jgi:hypothetical protein
MDFGDKLDLYALEDSEYFTRQRVSKLDEENGKLKKCLQNSHDVILLLKSQHSYHSNGVNKIIDQQLKNINKLLGKIL